MGSLSLLQGIVPTQGLNPGLLHCLLILYQLSHKGNPRILEWVAYPFSRGSSWSRNRTGVFCITGWFFTSWAVREALNIDFLFTRYFTLSLLVIALNSHSDCLSLQRIVVKKNDRHSNQVPWAEILAPSWMWIIGRKICLPLWVVVHLSNMDNHSANLRVAVRIKWLTYKKPLTTVTGICRELSNCHPWSWWRWLGWLLWNCARGWRSRQDVGAFCRALSAGSVPLLLPPESPQLHLQHLKSRVCRCAVQLDSHVTMESLKHGQSELRRTINWASPVAQMVKNPPAMQEIGIWSPGQEEPLEKEMTVHSGILAWEISWTEELGGLQPMGSKELDMTEWLTLSLQEMWNIHTKFQGPS